jgi:hypothetical protein
MNTNTTDIDARYTASVAEETAKKYTRLFPSS